MEVEAESEVPISVEDVDDQNYAGNPCDMVKFIDKRNGYHSCICTEPVRCYQLGRYLLFGENRSNGCSPTTVLFRDASSLRSLSSAASFLYFAMTFSMLFWLPAGTLYGEPWFMILAAVSEGSDVLISEV